MAGRDVNGLLSKLGLTEYESKTIGTLFKIGESEAPAISRLAQVPKTRVYDVLDKLVEKNLVIEIRGRPKRYRSVEAKKAFNLLIDNKKSELESLQKNVASLESMLLTNSEKELVGETVMKVKDKRDFERILGQEISKAKTSLTGFSEITDKEYVLQEAIEKAGIKKANIKLINTYKNQALQKASDMRQLDHGLNAFIIDNKKVILALSDFKQDKPEYHFTIFQNNKPIANALQHYFDKIWQQAKK